MFSRRCQARKGSSSVLRVMETVGVQMETVVAAKTVYLSESLIRLRKARRLRA